MRREMAAYDPHLANRPEVLTVTKAELPEAADLHARLQTELGRPVLLISAVTGQNLHHLVQAIWEQLETAPPVRFDETQPVVPGAEMA